jgi:Ca-activated chloride channel family protein
MRFSRPELIHLLWPALVLIPVLLVWAIRSADKARRSLFAEELVPKLARGWNARRRTLKAVLQGAALLLLLFALAGPRVGSREITVKRSGADLMFVLDCSLSMRAEDIPPTRLAKAKRQVSALFERLDGDRVGIVCFAGDAFLQCPLTLDYGAARMFLEVLDENSVSKPGTNIGGALRTAIDAFPDSDGKHQAILLVTDGDDHSGEAERAAEEAAQRGIRIYAIGVGSEHGEPIPLADRSDGYKKDRQGEIVMTVLDTETLERVALAADGEFHRATTGELELDRIYDSIARLEEKELASRSFTQWEERFQFPLGLALLLLLFDFCLPEVVRPKKEWEGRFA